PCHWPLVPPPPRPPPTRRSPALERHPRALGAIAAGHFADEILPITVDLGRRGTRTVTADEGPRPDTSLAALAELRPVVTGGSVVTAGNSSSLNDGSSALLLASRAAVEKYQLS